jgi:uncharacterized protein YqeY
MGTLVDQLGNDLKDAMRAGDTVRRDEIRGLLAALRSEQQAKLTRELSKRGLIVHGEDTRLTAEQEMEVDRLRADVNLSTEDERAVLQQRAKMHRQAIEGFQRGNRPDLVSIEEAQMAVLERYLPKQLESSELEQVIRDAIAETGAQGARDQGKVMGLLAQRLRGRADLKHVSARVQTLLGASP